MVSEELLARILVAPPSEPWVMRPDSLGSVVGELFAHNRLWLYRPPFDRYKGGGRSDITLTVWGGPDIPEAEALVNLGQELSIQILYCSKPITLSDGIEEREFNHSDAGGQAAWLGNLELIDKSEKTGTRVFRVNRRISGFVFECSAEFGGVK